MLRKITRIFFRTTGIVFLFLFLIVVFLFFAVQTFTFQTWLAKQAGSYLSAELNTKVEVKKVELELFTKANLQGIFILDKHQDTILHGDLLVDISNFNYRQQTIRLNKIALRNVTSKLIKYSADSTFNYQFLVDYFDSGKTDTTSKQEWKVSFGDVLLQNVSFVYRKEKFVTPVTHNINFDDIWLQHTFGKISGFRMDKDTIVAQITGLQTTEQTGFKLSELSAKARISGQHLVCDELTLKTPKTFIRGKVDFTQTSWDDYQDFINKVNMNCYLRDSSYVSFTDIAAFAYQLNGLDETVQLSGSVKGTVSDMRLKKFQLAFGNYTRFNGNVQMTGLPDIQTTFLHFDAKELSTNYQDLVRIPDYPFNEGKYLQLPGEIERLGTISYSGKFDGFVTDFTTYGKFKTGLGRVQTDLSIKIADKSEDIIYHGKSGIL